MGISNENMGVSNENMGVSNENMGVSNENMGVSNENMGVSKESLGVSNRTPTLMQISSQTSIMRKYWYKEKATLKTNKFFQQEGVVSSPQ